MAKENGGIIGVLNTPSTTSASGVWALQDQYEAKRNGTWPLTPFVGTNSLRFNSGSSDVLTRTPASTSGNQIFTVSMWVKRANLGGSTIFYAYQDGNNADAIGFNGTDNSFQVAFYDGGAYTVNLITTQLFRDVSAWYHFVVAIDTTQATNTNRAKLYVNGSQVTAFSTATYPSQNATVTFNKNVFHTLGSGYYGSYSDYCNLYLSEINWITGQQLTPSSFGASNASGVWYPIPYAGSYGTNGYNLKFGNSASLGTDSSPNGNNWTVNNLTSVDQSTDTELNNFCTLDPLNIANPSYVNTLSEGNLTAYKPEGDGSYFTSFANFSPSKGKWYWEVKPTSLTTTLALGIYFGQNTFTTSYPFDANVFYCHQNGIIYYNGSTYTYMASYTSNDIVTFALDMDNGKFYMGKNGSWANGTGSTNQTFANAVSITDDIPASFPTGKDVFPIATVRNAYGNFNFGSPPYAANNYADAAGYGNFSYAVPSGYYALCTKNLNTYG
jgi:hypothetical protein